MKYGFCLMLIGLSALAVPTTAGAQPAAGKRAANRPPATDQPRIISLVVDPAPEPRPALKYSLLPRMNERKPGNAAPYYYRAILNYTMRDLRENRTLGQQFNDWMDMPLDQFPAAEVRRLVQWPEVYDELRIGAYREECDWDWRLQDLDGTAVWGFMMEELDQSRAVARFLGAKARLEVFEHRYDDALETMRVGYQFGQDVATPPQLIPALVGIGVTSIMDEQLIALVQSPASPNLYWALTELPSPMIDMRPALEFELYAPFRTFPFLKDAETAQRSPEEWAELISRAMQKLLEVMDANERPLFGGKGRLLTAALLMKGYPQAKRDLIEQGYDAAKVERMSVGQVIAIHEAWICHFVADELRKTSLLPYSVGRDRFSVVNKRLRQEGLLAPINSSREAIPIANTVMPAVMQANEAMTRRDVTVAGFRAVEAIRMQAAIDGGKLPATLADITVVPVPNHPRWEKPFPYRVEGNKAILEVRRFTQPDEPLHAVDWIFEIDLRGK